MRIAYVEMIGGVAGDMLLAAFLDAGLDRDGLERALRSLVPDGWTLAPRRVEKHGIAATFAGLVVPGEDGHPEHDSAFVPSQHHRTPAPRTLDDVLALLERSRLGARARERAARIYRALAESEERTGTAGDDGGFHAMGRIDAVLDVAATCLALDLLEIDELRCSPFPVGRGPIVLHGRVYPNPHPSTAYLTRGWPARALDVDGELVTPTGAAIVSGLARPGEPPATVERSGYGAGRSDFTVPNVTRVLIGPG